jgi:hypothetical protein
MGKKWPVKFTHSDSHVIAGFFFNMPQITNMERTALLPLRRKTCSGYFRTENLTASAGLESAIWVPVASMLTATPPKPL